MEIVNRVANSKLLTFDLEELYPKGERVAFDISPWLFEGIVLREKDFREKVANHDWSQYEDIAQPTQSVQDGHIFFFRYI